MEDPRRTVSFIVRLSTDDAGGLIGTVERVTSGEKHRFRAVEAIGPLIARMIGAGVAPASDPGAATGAATRG